jgi:hypothetical protein
LGRPLPDAALVTGSVTRGRDSPQQQLTERAQPPSGDTPLNFLLLFNAWNAAARSTLKARGRTGGLFMSYNDNRNRNRADGAQANYIGWIVGGVVALAVVLGIFAFSNHTGDTNSASNNSPATTTGTAPSATGSGTTDTPANVPTPPAKPASPAR